MRQWERAYRAKIRRTRRQHPLPPWVHVAWLLIFGVITWRYYTLFDLVPGDRAAMALLLGLQVVYFYIVVFGLRSEEHTSELQSLMRISYAVFCLKKKNH